MRNSRAWGERMRVTPRGIQLLTRFEGCELRAYKDQAGIWTIGYGHTGPEVREGMVITQKEAERLLTQDLSATEIATSAALRGVTLHELMFDALVCFVYNVGIEAFHSSTMLTLLKVGEFGKAANEFARWNKAGGKTNRGLTNRRAAERDLFLQGLQQLQVKMGTTSPAS